MIQTFFTLLPYEFDLYFLEVFVQYSLEIPVAAPLEQVMECQGTNEYTLFLFFFLFDLYNSIIDSKDIINVICN